MSFRESFKHAFKVDPPGPAEPSPQQVEVIDRVCRAAVKRRLTTPALMALEMGRPLNFVAAQVVHFFRPIASAVLDTRGIKHFADFLEQRGSVEYLCRRLEHFEQESSVGDEACDADTTNAPEHEQTAETPADAGPDEAANR